MFVALRRFLPSRLAALLGVTAVLCSLGLEVHAAMLGHTSGHGHAAGLDAATAGHPHEAGGHAHANEAGGHAHANCDPSSSDGLPSQAGGTGCCHAVACPAGVASLPPPRAGDLALVATEAAASTDAGTLRGLRHSPPLRPPR